MRYPAYLLLPLTGIFSVAHAVSYAAPAKPAPAASSSPAAVSDEKPVPVTTPVDLFNGKDLTGWSYIVGDKPSDITKVCSVKDGVLVCTGTPSGYLQVGGVRENYVLHFEWRWPTTNPKNNGGGLINMTAGTLQQDLWPICFQAQLKTQSAGDFIVMSTATSAEAGPGKTATKQKDVSEKPVGEWNAADVVVRGDTITYIVNGVTQNKLTKCAPSFGKIGFQLEGYPYEMRNVKLLPLPATTP